MAADPDQSGAKASALNKDRILSLLKHDPAPVLRVEQELDSTSDHLARLRQAGHDVDVVIANAQSAGRGRRGRRWISPPGAGLYLSLFRPFEQSIRQLASLGLVAGVAAAEAIEQTCGISVGLKWPNDLQIDGRKVAGCLVDTEKTAQASAAIIGIGINIDLREHSGPDQPWTDLVSVTGQAVDRNRLSAALIRRLTELLSEFDRAGFIALREHWAQRDILNGHPIEVFDQDRKIIGGRAMGVDELGQLLVEVQGQIHRLHGGEVTLRRLL